ncbi:MAG: hypothetical protein WCO98_16895 [bacterium]
MSAAYTPGLLVTTSAIINRLRRLPINGEVLVKVGDNVDAEDIIACALLPGPVNIIRIAEKLALNQNEIMQYMKVKENDVINKGDVIAETKGFMGFFGSKIESPYEGTIEYISRTSGTVGIREPATPLNLKAYISGTVTKVIDNEGVIIETAGAMVQGIFGVGGERRGRIKTISASADAMPDDNAINEQCAGTILNAGASVNINHIRKAVQVGAIGIIVGAINDAVLRAYLGYDIGVAITGQEEIPLTLILTEGFGSLDMASRTFDLLKKLDGEYASINGATQIRAGVIRPEIIIPHSNSGDIVEKNADAELVIGTRVRVIREPHFGRFANITELPAELHVIPTGAKVRVAKVKFNAEEEDLIPRANLEIYAE